MNVQDILNVFSECTKLGLSLPKFAAIYVLPRMPYQTHNLTTDSMKSPASVQKDEFLQSVETKVDTLTRKVGFLSGYLETPQNQARASYAKVTFKGCPDTNVTHHEEENQEQKMRVGRARK